LKEGIAMLTSTSGIARAALLFVLVPLTLCTTAAQAQTALRWKFKAGDKINYVTEQNTTSKGSIMGMEIETKMSQIVEMSWTVKSVTSDGVAEMTQTIDRMRMNMQMPFGGFDFDSKDGKDIEGPIGEIIGPILKTLAGAEMSLKMDATGAVRDIKLPEKLVESLGSNPILAQFGEMFSEDGIKQMTQGGAGSVGSFPKNPVSKGETWEKKAEMKNPFGTIVVVTSSTYAGPETRDGVKLEKIDLKMTQTIEPAPGGMFEIKIGEQDSKGAAYFDNTQGRLVNQELKQKMKMEIDVMGNVIEQDVETVMTIKLASGDAKKTK
jgi:Family of unknown function (DUF6263)